MFDGTLRDGVEYELNNGDVFKCVITRGGCHTLNNLAYNAKGHRFGMTLDHPYSVRGRANGTLAELHVQIGDEVMAARYAHASTYVIDSVDDDRETVGAIHNNSYMQLSSTFEFRIKSRATTSIDDIPDIKTPKDASDVMFNRYLACIKEQPSEDDDSRTSLKNLAWMCEISTTNHSMSNHKASRWLGFIQGCLATRGIIDVDDERDFSRAIFHQTEGVSPSVSRETAKPTQFGDMENSEKGSLLLADHNGDEIQAHMHGDVWEEKTNGTPYRDTRAYRIKPSAEEVAVGINTDGVNLPVFDTTMTNPTHILTYTVTTDGSVEITNPVIKAV